MTNQAAQTMPEPVTASMCPSSDYAKGWNDCLAALSQTAGVAEGFVMVPVEPTPEMVSAFRSAPLDLEDVLYQERLIAGVEPDVTNVKQVGPAIDARLFRKSYASMLAAAPAASGGEDDDDEAPKPTAMQIRYAEGYSDGVRDTERIAKERESSAASVSERARELLAAEYSKCGMQQCAADIRSGVFAAAQQLAVNAIKAALEQKVPSGEVAIVCDWKDADPFPTFIEAEIGGKSVSLEWRDRPDGLKELIVPVTDSALRAIEQALTQQRGECEDAHKFRRLAQLLDGFDFRLGRNVLMPPATYLDSVEITCEFQPGIGQSVIDAIVDVLTTEKRND